MLKSTGVYFLELVAASYFGLLIEFVTVTPLRFSGNATLAGVLSCILGVLAAMGFFCFLCRREGYHDNDGTGKNSFKRALISACIAFFVYVLITIIIRYRHPAAAVFATGFAGLMAHAPSNADLSVMAAEYGGWMFLSFLICTLPLIPAMIFGYRYGYKRRQREREELTKEKTEK